RCDPTRLGAAVMITGTGGHDAGISGHDPGIDQKRLSRDSRSRSAESAVTITGIRSQQLQVHRLQRDEQLIANLMALQERFWQYVTSDTPPPADGSESAATALQCLYPRDAAAQADFSQDREMSAVFTELEEAREQIDKYKHLEEQFKQRIQHAMGDASK